MYLQHQTEKLKTTSHKRSTNVQRARQKNGRAQQESGAKASQKRAGAKANNKSNGQKLQLLENRIQTRRLVSLSMAQDKLGGSEGKHTLNTHKEGETMSHR